MSQLLDWIEDNKERLDWRYLSMNPAAIHLITAELAKKPVKLIGIVYVEILQRYT